MLQIRSLAKAFAGAPVIAGLDLDITNGGTTAVVGPSGCGKTTLLRIIAGFEQPDSGTVAIGGSTVSGPGCEVAPHQRGVGYVTQDGALFPHLTVGQNIAYGLRGPRSAASQELVRHLLKTVSLDADLAGRRPDELSGGQQQRVALARALARRPALMLLDEPFSSLDARLRATTRNAVAQTLREAAVTTLLVTHDQQEALSIADQVAVLLDGHFTQVGSPQEVYRTPANRATAEFLGDCVFLDCSVSGGSAECALGRVAVRTSVDGPGTLLLRPEQLRATALPDGGRGSESGVATGVVVASEFLGGDVFLTIDIGAATGPVTSRQNSFTAPPRNAGVRVDVVGDGVVFGSGRGVVFGSGRG
jgi:iron(III) transport system ATP-binding protein